jgi:hypothetical protein
VQPACGEEAALRTRASLPLHSRRARVNHFGRSPEPRSCGLPLGGDTHLNCGLCTEFERELPQHLRQETLGLAAVRARTRASPGGLGHRGSRTAASCMCSLRRAHSSWCCPLQCCTCRKQTQGVSKSGYWSVSRTSPSLGLCGAATLLFLLEPKTQGSRQGQRKPH